MITKNLTKALEEIGFSYFAGESSDKSHVYAVYGGYLVSIYEESGNKVAYFNFRFGESEENDLKKYGMSETFSNEIEEFSVTDYTLFEDGMRVYSSGNIPTFLKLIDRCIALLIENDIRGIEFCSKCGNKFGNRNPKKVTDNKENYLMCEHCAIETVEEVSNRIDEQKRETSKEKVFPAVLTSILFSIFGTLVYFILYYWLSPAMSDSGMNEIRYIFCITGFLVSVFAYLGYRIFSKKASLAAYISVTSNALIFTAIGQYIGVVFEFIALNGFSLSALSDKHFWLVHLRNTTPAEIAEYFTDHSAIFFKLLIISLMFAAVGAAIFLLSLHDKSAKKPDNVIVETISIK